MIYYIITEYFAAPTCDLTGEQFERFFKLCQELPEEYDDVHNSLYEHEKPVLIIDYRCNWEKLQWEMDMDKGIIETPVLFVMVVPATIINNAPRDFIYKKSHYRNVNDRDTRSGEEKKYGFHQIQKDLDLLEHLLGLANGIQDNDQEVEQIQTTSQKNSLGATEPMASQVNSNNSGTKTPKPRGRKCKSRTIWVHGRIDENLSDREINDKWNNMSYTERMKITYPFTAFEILKAMYLSF